MAVYCQKDDSVPYMFRPVFMDSMQFFGYVNGAGSIQKILDTRLLRSLNAQLVSPPNAFEMQLYFHALLFLE